MSPNARLTIGLALTWLAGCGAPGAGVDPASPAAAPTTSVQAAPKPLAAEALRASDEAPNDRPSQPPPPLDLSTVPGASASLQEISLDATELRDLMLSAITTGNVGLPAALTKLKSDQSRRVKLIETLGPLLPRIVSSTAFHAAYAHRRASELAIDKVPKPTPPRSAKDLHAERVAAAQKQLAETERALKEPGLPKAATDALTPLLKLQREQLAEIERSRDSEAAAVDKQRFELEQADYAERVKAREVEIARRGALFPEDVNALVAKRLDEFVELAASIDFGAKLDTRGARKVFANPTLEAKSPAWKLAFRAGKPTVDAARRVAEAWRAQLSPKK